MKRSWKLGKKLKKNVTLFGTFTRTSKQPRHSLFLNSAVEQFNKYALDIHKNVWLQVICNMYSLACLCIFKSALIFLLSVAVQYHYEWKSPPKQAMQRLGPRSLIFPFIIRPYFEFPWNSKERRDQYVGTRLKCRSCQSGETISVRLVM